ncbi:hypothetical protein K3495_g14023 [Podosphaera aphanis]|nr:hypothetical protein K3495_g14023 [Podosphaera aphanis]
MEHAKQRKERRGIELEIATETLKLGWHINESPSVLEEPQKSHLDMMLTDPPVKKIDLRFPLGLEVTARNIRGVTIRDALDVIYKHFRRKEDDEIERPVLAGFEWNKEECWTRLIVHCKKEGFGQSQRTVKKSK